MKYRPFGRTGWQVSEINTALKAMNELRPMVPEGQRWLSLLCVGF
jgi:hypothetical protein